MPLEKDDVIESSDTELVGYELGVEEEEDDYTEDDGPAEGVQLHQITGG